MREFYIENFDKFFYQNKCEYMDSFEGCLLDNYMLSCKNGIAFVYEHYLNPNSSNYLVKFFKSKNLNETEFNKELDTFEQFRDEIETL